MKRAISVIAAVLLLAGCSSVPESFSNAPVDRDGAFYVQCSPQSVSAAWQNYCQELIDNNAPEAVSPHSGAVKKIRHILFAKIIANYSGINWIECLKASSTATPDGKFINSVAVKTADGNQVGISVFGNNSNLASEIAKLPDNCRIAWAGALDWNAVVNSTKNSKHPFAEKAFYVLGRLLGDTPQNLAGRHSGIAVVALYSRENGETTASLSLPDSEKRLFNRCKEFSDNPKDEIIHIGNNEGLNYFAAHKEGRIILSFDYKTINSVISPAKTLKATPHFADLIRDFNHPAVFLSWDNEEKTPCVFSLRRTDYGFFGHGIDNNDWNSGIFKTTVFRMLDFFIKFIDIPEPPKANTRSQAVSKRPAVKIDHSKIECLQKINLLAKALGQYREKHNSYPEKLHRDGLKQLADSLDIKLETMICPAKKRNYVYFGSWERDSSGKLPILIDMPDAHTGVFHAVLNDGSVRSFVLTNQMSVKRIASFLHTVCQYSEEEFLSLIKRAEQLDKLLDKESK
ncbi:MAG: hypothetical protein J6S90_04860 [Lentisphaeria bacterium]|nr:hypothetical protein [Lentisphaeria bacterium]